jgi:hypothetical protein
MDYRLHMKQIEEAIGEAKAADRIIEGPWFDVVMRRAHAKQRAEAK